jgi:predicted HTH domain antitoxin
MMEPVMSTVNLNLDEDLMDILGELKQPVDKAALELIVLELYRMGRLSSGRAAAQLGMSRLDFIQHASDLGIPYLRLGPDDLDADIQVSRSL